jgi:hypothetical protein
MSKTMIVRAASITAALALMGGATVATFSATASNTGNTFGAGTLHLSLKELNKTLGTPIFTWTNAKPGDSVTQIIDLSNDGTINATTLQLSSISVTPTPGTHDVSAVLTLTVWNDLNQNGLMDGGSETVYKTAKLNDPSWSNLAVGDLTTTLHRYLGAQLTFDSTASNDYQGEGANFGFSFIASQ